MKKSLLINAVRCKHCNQIIVSSKPIGRTFCNCKQVAVCGGYEEMLRRGQINEDYEELSVIAIKKRKSFRKDPDSISRLKYLKALMFHALREDVGACSGLGKGFADLANAFLLFEEYDDALDCFFVYRRL